MSSASLISLSLKPCPRLFEVSTKHGQRKEHCDRLPACFEIWCQLCLGDLLYGDKAKCAFDEFLSTSWKDKPFLACLRVFDLRGHNLRDILFAAKGKGYLNSFRLLRSWS